LDKKVLDIYKDSCYRWTMDNIMNLNSCSFWVAGKPQGPEGLMMCLHTTQCDEPRSGKPVRGFLLAKITGLDQPWHSQQTSLYEPLCFDLTCVTHKTNRLVRTLWETIGVSCPYPVGITISLSGSGEAGGWSIPLR